MENAYHPETGQYQNFEPQQRSDSNNNNNNNNMVPYTTAGNNMYGAQASAPQMYTYGVPPPMGQYNTGYPPLMPNSNGHHMQLYNGYAHPQHSQQQLATSYGPSHMASYANGAPNRRSTFSVVPAMDISMPPLAIKIFAERDEDGRPIPPMFLTVANHEAGVINIQHVSCSFQFN
jgi:hypothetical protein